jgi:hypothetical protein
MATRRALGDLSRAIVTPGREALMTQFDDDKSREAYEARVVPEVPRRFAERLVAEADIRRERRR